jgi:hypothetical protein
VARLGRIISVELAPCPDGWRKISGQERALSGFSPARVFSAPKGFQRQK